MKNLVILIFAVAFHSCSAQKKSPPLPVAYDTIYKKPTVSASNPGGDAGWKAYVKKHVKYPRKAWWQEVETDVTVRVVIDKDGTVASAQSLNTTTFGFEQEAMRLVLKSGKWTPATYHGQAVKSEGELKVEFRLK